MSSLSASVNEADMVRLVQAGPFTAAQEVADFLDADQDERALMISNARLQGTASVASSWDTFVAVAKVVLTVAGAVTSITGAISSVYSLTQIGR